MEGYSVTGLKGVSGYALNYNIDLKLKHNSGLTVKKGTSLIVAVSYFSAMKIYENLEYNLFSKAF